MNSFDNWIAMHPYAWHPGLEHSKDQHMIWIQACILSVQRMQVYGMQAIANDLLKQLEKELPDGFMGPYEQHAYQKYENLSGKFQVRQATVKLERSFQEFMLVDSDAAISKLQKLLYRARKPRNSVCT